MRDTASTVLAAVVAAAVVVSPNAQVSDRRDAPRTWQAWLDAVDTHVPGQRDDAVERIAPWSRDDLQSIVGPLSRQALPDRLRLVARALVLHTDIAILYRADRGYNLPAGATAVTLFKDGRAVGQMSDTYHWEFARLLIDRAPAGEDRLRIGREFYRATAATLQLWNEFPELTRHLAVGRRFLGDDAVLLLIEGTMHQAYAGPRAQRFFDERRGSKPPTMITSIPGPGRASAPTDIPSLPAALPTIKDSRAQAERLFRRALAIDPKLAEARIRLAHVLGDAERHDEAAAELERARGAKLSPLLDYYAALLTGREARARGAFGAARVAFERAAAIYPNASAPRHGLSELAMARGDSAESLTHALAGGAAAHVDANEPWWWLERAHDPSAQTLVEEMRRAVPR